MIILFLERRIAADQTWALLQLLANGRKEIEEGRTIPAVDVFTQVESMDREDSE
ncbi:MULTISPECIES: hypothetical protein [Achromobacter]|uniref:hypothetical protein n=1 Tax=Achromobacter TaxID=222 RepID=UPI0025BD8047|nr:MULTISPECIES: hypothetical protein [Achromobacter]